MTSLFAFIRSQSKHTQQLLIELLFSTIMASTRGLRAGKYTLRESLDIIHKSRKSTNRVFDKLGEAGWQKVDPKKQKFTYEELDKVDVFTTLKFSRHSTKCEIFLAFMSEDLVDAVLSRIEHHLVYPNKRRIMLQGKLYTSFLLFVYAYKDYRRDPKKAPPLIAHSELHCLKQ